MFSLSEAIDFKMKNENTLSTLDRAVDIFLLLEQEGREMGVTEIAKALGVNKSTIYRSLATLESRDFLQQNTETGKYWLGLKLYSLGMLISEKMMLKGVALPYVRALSQKLNEVSHLAVLDRTAVEYPKQIIIDKVETQHLLSLTPPVGSSAPCHSSGVGKCLLAFTAEKYVQKFVGNPLPRFTKKTITNWDTLKQQLAQIRQDGFAADDEELEEGLSCVAAPILNKERQVVAAISISGPTSRLRTERFDEIVCEVKKTARAISIALH